MTAVVINGQPPVRLVLIQTPGVGPPGADGTGEGGSMTAAEILTAIKTVDGVGSGLDADLLDGLSSAAFDPAGSAAAVAASLGDLATLDTVTAPTDITASGTPSATTYLRGDGTWATPAGGGSSDPLDSNNLIANRVFGR